MYQCSLQLNSIGAVGRGFVLHNETQRAGTYTHTTNDTDMQTLTRFKHRFE